MMKWKNTWKEKQDRQFQWHFWPFCWGMTELNDTIYFLCWPPFIRRRVKEKPREDCMILPAPWYEEKYEWKHFDGVTTGYRKSTYTSGTGNHYSVTNPLTEEKTDNIVQFYPTPHHKEV